MRLISALLVSFLAFVLASASLGAEVKVEGVLKAVDVNDRTLTVEKKTAKGTKELSLEVAEEAGDLASLKVGDEVSLAYDSTLEVVTKIVGPTKETPWLFYDFTCKGVLPEKSVRQTNEEEIHCLPYSPDSRGAFMLVTSKEYEACVFRCEFFYDAEAMEGNPMVGIASSLPPMKTGKPADQFPKAIEVKLWHRGFGSVLLPTADFKAEMVYGQAREGRVVPVLKQQVPTRNGWNTLEIEIKEDKTIIVKGNGVLLNAIAKVENTKGHIVVYPPACDFRIRNASVEVGGTKSALPFSEMNLVTCEKKLQ